MSCTSGIHIALTMNKDRIFTIVIAIFLLISLYVSLYIIKRVDGINDRLDRANTEYQFIIDDEDSIIVFDKERLVGSVKLEGQLDSLMIKDNE